MTRFFISSQQPTLEAARGLRDRMNSHLVPTCPLRFHRVVIDAPESGYLVVDLGFATTNGFPVVR